MESSYFEPIAIVGRSCILPNALDIQEFWDRVSKGGNCVQEVGEQRWRLDKELVLRDSSNKDNDKTWSAKGGYVEHFTFDPKGFQLSPQELQGLDPLFHWSLHCSKVALQGSKKVNLSKTGVILGNLSFPSAKMSRYAEETWLHNIVDANQKTDPRNRFMSGLPVLMIQKALGLGLSGFALDSACASSLYAIKYACDRLQSKQADAMLAGAVNCADDLFIHVGFSALQALSKTGQSRPFHRDADGLIPAEGAAMFLLKRLSDAEADGDRILGVIRGIGLCNDGRSRGLLVPSSDGQVRAMQRAYQNSDVRPQDISYVECHATGTSVGDATEVLSMKEVYGKNPVYIASLKSNMGHLITAAGAAGLLKVLGAFEHEYLPPTLHCDDEIDILKDCTFHLLRKGRDWTEPKRAAVSAFGFGGNNAHLIVSSYRQFQEDQKSQPKTSRPSQNTSDNKIAIVGLDIATGSAFGKEQVQKYLEEGLIPNRKMSDIPLQLSGIKFPPNDLKQALPQQNVLMELARRSIDGLKVQLQKEDTSVWVAMGCDTNVCRYGARWRMAQHQKRLAEDGIWLQNNRNAIIDKLTSAGVLGTMPNIPTNRINSQFDFQGMSSSISAEEGSSIHAIQCAIHAIKKGEIGTAVVGAVDLTCDVVHSRAKAQLGLDSKYPMDSAAVVILKDYKQACQDGDVVWGTLSDETSQKSSVVNYDPQWGDTHAASILTDVVMACLTKKKQTYSIQKDDMLKYHHQIEVHASGLNVESSPDLKGATLEIPSHWKEIQLPSTKMPLPTRLTPVVELADRVSAGNEERVETFASTTFVDTDIRSHRDNILEAPEDPQIDDNQFGISNVALEHHSMLTQLHQQFLEQQNQIHQQYLEHHQSMQQFLFERQDLIEQDIFEEHNLWEEQELPFSEQKISEAIALKNRPPEQSTSFESVQKVKATEPVIQVPTSSMDLGNHRFSEVPPSPVGMTLDYSGLQIHASGNISEIYGPLFVSQDAHAIQTRMPEPPLLLAHRMTGLKAEPVSMGKGTIWTESDVLEDSWHLHVGRMPAGIMIESGQADLMLISYLGIDVITDGDRAYRLLGCELMYHDDLPQVGDTLCYDIHVDGHAKHGDVRLFFFHYDCRINNAPRLTVREGQAGFFTKEELANSAGILWTPEEQELRADPVLDPPVITSGNMEFSFEQVEAFSNGLVSTCFGDAFYLANTHTRTPTIAQNKMLFLRGPVLVQPKGGVWGRGYLRCEVDISPDDWFFEGHFKNDPCMPGTLMFEGCLQAMAFFLTSQGHTIERDGWRFQPMRHRPYPLRCRGQVTPESKKLIYEVFVEEICAGPIPYIVADLLCTVDGRKAFHARAMGLELVPDHPMSTMESDLMALSSKESDVDVARDQQGFAFDMRAMMASALGKPSEAFGSMYKSFDGPRKVARLPGPPYHFMSRVRHISEPLNAFRAGISIDLEYDIPKDAWYFLSNGFKTMPFAVLLEAALQPCGWLASAVGSALRVDEDLSFRNLDGDGVLHCELFPNSGTLTTKVTLTNISQSAGMIIESFDVRCFVGETLVYSLSTVFGFFPQIALQNQVGLPITPQHKNIFDAVSDFDIDLTVFPSKYFGGTARLADRHLCMLDRITGYEATGGTFGKGWIRGIKQVNPSEWFFKAHFFQDPVQPGSLGIEALIQLLQIYMIESGLINHESLVDRNPRFEPLALERSMKWKYRGQVVPHNEVITTTMEIVEYGVDERGIFVIGNGSLWVDGKRIYEVENMGMRLVAGDPKLKLIPVDISEQKYWLSLHENRVLPQKKQLLLDSVEQSVEDLHLQVDLSEFRSTIQGRSVLFVANHQTAMESLAFCILGAYLVEHPVSGVAKEEHRNTDFGHFIEDSIDPNSAYRPLLYVDRQNPSALLHMKEMFCQHLHAKQSLLLHVDGTRAVSAGQGIQNISGMWFDIVEESNALIIPVGFSGGIDAWEKERRDHPRYRQHIVVGMPLDLTGLTMKEKKEVVQKSIEILYVPSLGLLKNDS